MKRRRRLIAGALLLAAGLLGIAWWGLGRTAPSALDATAPVASLGGSIDGADLPALEFPEDPSGEDSTAPDAPASVSEHAPTAETAERERPVRTAPPWLARHQDEDGAWRPGSFNTHCSDSSCAGPGTDNDAVATTAMAVLAFTSAGHTYRNGRYKQQVRLGLKYLVKQPELNGGWLAPDRSDGRQGYAQALGTLALGEAAGITHSPLLRKYLQPMVERLAELQLPGGGWPYLGSRSTPDTALTVWALLALRSAAVAEVPVPADRLAAGLRYLDCVCDDQQRPGWRQRGDLGAAPGGVRWMSSTRALQAAVACARLAGGVPRTDPRIVGALAALEADVGSGDPTRHGDACYVYFGRRLAHRCGGDAFTRWNRAQLGSTLRAQEREGCASGSFNPAGDLLGGTIGRAGITAFGVLTMSVYGYVSEPVAPPSRDQKPTQR